MTTDEMIMDLVTKHGFRLPECLEPGFPDGGGPDWYIQATIMDVSSLSAIEPQQAHDLCAAEFARQAAERQHDMFNRSAYANKWEQRCWVDYTAARTEGDSPAAIEALWRALQ